MSYPYDPDLRDYVARLLYDALPAFYKAEDERARLTPPEPVELETFIRAMAVPLAVARQSIEELYADLFIDSASDWVLPYLARMVGTSLVFPDADSNRRDVRGTVDWRRRKGTPAMLQDLGGDLTGELVVTQEGWKRVQITQDLDILRLERVTPLVRAPSLAERHHGPLGTLHKTVDARAITRTTGKYHPKHIVHWVHPTVMFPINGGTPADLRDPATDPDLRFAFNPLGDEPPMRARRTGAGDPLATDRVPPMIFTEEPGAWFGRDGRFDVRIAGVSAAVGVTGAVAHRLEHRAADIAVLDGAVELRLLRHEGRRFSGPVWVELHAVPFPGAPNLPDIAATQLRAGFRLDAAGVTATLPPSAAALPANPIAMIRLLPDGAVGRRFPGATIAIAGGTVDARRGSSHADAAQDGFLRGALLVELPALRIDGERWFYLAADGSLFEAQSAGSGAVDVPVLNAAPPILFAESSRRATSPGPGWPPLPLTADFVSFSPPLAAPGAGPVVLHGGGVLVDAGGGNLQAAPAGVTSGLVFALTFFGNGRVYEPMLRLVWTGDDPSTATWQPLGSDGLTVDAAANPIEVGPRYEVLGEIADEGRIGLALAVRFESSDVTARLTPAEVSFVTTAGRAVLIHLPELAVVAPNPDPTFGTDPALFQAQSPALSVGRDGSTWRVGTSILARRAAGTVAPLLAPAIMQRRLVRGRSLCQWRNEVPPGLMHTATPDGHLDIDVAHGLFAMSVNEPPQPHPMGPDGIAPSSLAVVYQEGYSAVVGARTEPLSAQLNQRRPTPTRIVSASGHLPPDAEPDWHALPRFRSLAEAFAAITLAPQANEVIEFADSATYRGEQLDWPVGPQTLVIQAAERHRPVVVIDAAANPGGATYQRLDLLGIALTFAAAGDLVLPPSRAIGLRFVSVLRPDLRVVCALEGGEGSEVVTVRSSILGAIQLTSAGTLHIRTSVVDVADTLALSAIDAPDGLVDIERSTVFGAVACMAIEASESIFMSNVEVTDRFRGCVRFSRVTTPSILPRRHRLAVGTRVDFVAVDRRDPAHARLSERCDPAISRGAEDGGEMGVFHDQFRTRRYEAYARRLREYTPAGLVSGIVRLD